MIRWAGAWVFYILGDLVSRPMGWRGHFCWLFPVYQWLMGASSDLQGETENGPWRRVSP